MNEWLLAGVVITLSGVLQAPTVNVTISGFTTDPSGAVVPGAKMTAANVVTGLKVEAESGSDGTLYPSTSPCRTIYPGHPKDQFPNSKRGSVCSGVYF
jgi:hypothetical protein